MLSWRKPSVHVRKGAGSLFLGFLSMDRLSLLKEKGGTSFQGSHGVESLHGFVWMPSHLTLSVCLFLLCTTSRMPLSQDFGGDKVLLVGICSFKLGSVRGGQVWGLQVACKLQKERKKNLLRFYFKRYFTRHLRYTSNLKVRQKANKRKRGIMRN